MTQKQLILDYLNEYGYIIPAKMGGRIYKGKMFGSETGRRCRELRNEGLIMSDDYGKFEKYYTNNPRQRWVYDGEIARKI